MVFMDAPTNLHQLTVLSQLLKELQNKTEAIQIKIIKAAGENDLRLKLKNKNKKKYILGTMATTEKQATLEEIMQELEATPDSPAPSAVPAVLNPASNDIPNQRKRLAILISTGKTKNAVGVQLTHEQVKRLTDKEVAKFYKRYEAYVGNKTTETLIDSFLMLVSKRVGMFVSIDSVRVAERPQKRLHHQPRIGLRCGAAFHCD